ncbi:PRD domain-containing protein, partial [uncultured Lactobacillus sp.]|uniref:BglG family transcription antiterminator n=1 Tax=uncultured Lactobacillus sp. TaxID=153152 RepID=UPI0026292D3A
MEKKDRLLQYLQKNPGWHTSQELAVEIGSSKRTIKNYISQLNSRNNLIESSVRGYKYNADKLISPSSRTSQNNIPTNKEERVNYIINFLINNASTVNLYDLSENLFVSETTILQDLRAIQTKVQRFNMKLKRDGEFWHLIGNERQKRSLLSSLIYEETTGTFMNRSIIQDNFPDIDVTLLRSIILDTCSSNNIYLNTFDLNNILLHFAIVISRLQTGHLMKQNEVSKIPNKRSMETQAYRIVSTIEKEYGVGLEEPDRKELSLILQASISGNNKVEDNINVETKKLVDDLITYVWKTYQIDLNNDNFKERFSLHLDRLITRALTNKVEHNPIVGNIKISSPTIYECAVLMAHRIGEKIGIQIEDNEIAYIALHIGNAIAEQMSDRQKLSVLVLMPHYYDNSAILSTKLQSQFSTYINIKGIISDSSQIKNYTANVDILIAVNSNYIDHNISTVNISQFLLPEDIQKLN